MAAAVFYTGWDLLGARELKPERRIDSKTLFDLVKLSFGVVAGAGALVALVVAYRRQRVDEDGALRDATRLHTERFTTAVSQLGDESAAVRLGGVHALAGLADDAPTRDLRQTCIDVLCAYLRLPYTAEADLPANDVEARHTYLALREVRHTIIRLIGDRLRPPADYHPSWQGHDFDFRGVVFDGGDFSRVRISSDCMVNFGGATFSGGLVNFYDSTFSGGSVNFGGATFSGGLVNFEGSRFSGSRVSFHGATFSGGTVEFQGSHFSDGRVDFMEATFSSGTVHFDRATFSGGTVQFVLSRFSGSRVVFHLAQFDRIGSPFPWGTLADFSGATFSGGTVEFTEATFGGGNVCFSQATFDGSTVDFVGSAYSGGTVDFQRARFSDGTVDFSGVTLPNHTLYFGEATFSGGIVNFDGASGAAPPSLLPLTGSPPPNGLILPAAWQPGAS
ncbi:pentapeptide repeat-containing protein [Streptomyces sp. NPDC093598]|uniref:pentapeptide repeat-containing protein n=1 Tax=Streptomyces sp. NPDC093598 TaxID=3366046 RepID=UPI0037FDE3EF